MTNTIDLSIIIVNWNCAPFLRKCLASIFANRGELKLEILVIDNGSADDAGEMVAKEFPGVVLLRSRENLGFARANNLAFARSTGRNVLFLNPDTEIVGSALSVMVSALEAAPDCGAVGAKLLNSDLSVQTSCIQSFPSILNQALDLDNLRTMFPRWSLWGMRPLFDNPAGPVEVDVISGACLMARRKAFVEAGKFSPEYFMYTEDVDLCYKIRRRGWKLCYVPDAVVIHHGGGSSDAKPESNFVPVMMRESMRKFLRARRGRIYAAAYQGTMALVAVCRLFVLGSILVVTRGRFQRNSLPRALGKWAGILRWALRREECVKALRPLGRA